MEGLKVLLLCACVTVCHSHMRFVCPRPESSNSGIKSGPCEKKTAEKFDEDYMELSPGPLTLKFEETVFHTGAPTVVSLNEWGDETNSCRLLDHVPHNEAGEMSLGFSCWLWGYPVGKCKSQHYLTVNIPDIKCDRCYLQLLSVMTDKYTKDELPCVQMDMGNNNCSTYYSCANIKIRPTSQGRNKDMSTCNNYRDNLQGKWPYRPRQQYQALFVMDKVINMNVQFDSYDSSVTYALDDLLPEGASISFMQTDSKKTIHSAGQSSGKFTASKTVLGLLQAGKLTASIAIKEKQYRAQVVLQKKMYEPNIYDDHGVNFSPIGWLQGTDYVGQNAIYPFVVQPAGVCSSESRNFGAVLDVSDSTDTRGVFSLTVTENRAWVRGVVTGVTDEISSLDFISSSAETRPFSVPVSEIKDGRINVILNISSHLDLLTNDGMFDKVVVKTDYNAVLEAKMEEALLAPLSGPDGYTGEAVAFLREFGDLEYGALAIDAAGTPALASINGPAMNNIGGPVVLNVTQNVEVVDDKNWFTTGTWKNMGSSNLLSLWSGLLYMDMKTAGTMNKDRGISGQFTVPSKQLCKNGKFKDRCHVVELSQGNDGVEHGDEVMDTNGLATFVIDDTGAIRFSIALRDLKKDENITEVALRNGWWNAKTLTVNKWTTSPAQERVIVTEGVVSSPSSELLQQLAGAELSLRVSTSRYTLSSVRGDVPAIRQRPASST